MAMLKRIFLFMIVNVLVIVTISIATSLLGIQPYLSAQGINYESLMIFCLMWGMGGAFISLMLSRIMARWMMGVKIIAPDTRDTELSGLLQKVHRLARSAGLGTMPQVGIFKSPDINAFATGPTKSRSMVAVSSGLLAQMNDDETEGVIGHEIAHIANGDMVTMTLVQGIVNAFVMFFARIIAFFVSSTVDERYQFMVRFGVTIALQIAFSFLGMMVVAWFSRLREFRADAGGARLAGREKMVAALQALERNFTSLQANKEKATPSVATMKISGKSGGLMALLSTHPPLQERIRQLQGGKDWNNVSEWHWKQRSASPIN